MIRRRKQPSRESGDRWLVSYADFITLLFAFFVVMFANSQTDRAKAQQISESVRTALKNGGFPSASKSILGGTVDETGPGNAQRKGPGGAMEAGGEKKREIRAVELATSFQLLKEALKGEIDAGRIRVNMEPRGLAISFTQAALFPSGEDAISTQARESLRTVASAVLKVPNPIRLEGHTDSVPIHNPRYRSNWELSAARSIALLEMLATDFGVPRQRMSIGGYAEIAPLDSNATEEGRARNRRVDLIILNEAGAVAEPGVRPDPATRAINEAGRPPRGGSG